MKPRSSLVSIAILACSVAWSPASAQRAGNSDDSQSRMNAQTLEGLGLRSIGPAFKSGRIADLSRRESSTEAAGWMSHNLESLRR